MKLDQKTGALLILAAAGIGAAFYAFRSRAAAPLLQSAVNAPAAPTQATLDPGLSTQESQAVNIALTMEANPSNLHAFATTLTPDFPIAASLLTSRARALGGV